MTDVRTEPAPTLAGTQPPNARGDFIWYELITPDPTGAKAFYDAVVGWTSSKPRRASPTAIA